MLVLSRKGRGADQEFAIPAVRRRNQARPTKGSGRPINIVTTLAGSGMAVAFAVTANPSVGEADGLGVRLKEMKFVNVYGVVKEGIGAEANPVAELGPVLDDEATLYAVGSVETLNKLWAV